MKQVKGQAYNSQGGNDMSTTQPIRDKKQLEQFKDYYKAQNPNPRNYTIIMLGLHSALRINDILHLTVDMVYQGKKVRNHIVVKERKTGKENRVLLTAEMRRVLKEYRVELEKNKMHRAGNPYLFPGARSIEKPLSRSQAYRMIREAAEALAMDDHISCHSLRKTFGYRAWKQGHDPIAIMIIFNHSSLNVTKRYLCLDQDDKDEVYERIQI